MSIKNIIWDFDGVIINSIPTKTAAFAYIFRDYPHISVVKLLDYHLANGGISRFDKIQYFFTDIIKQPLSKELANDLADEFAKFALTKLYEEDYLIEDTINFIKSYSTKYRMHIASGAWQKELLHLCAHHKIDQYFLSIHGSPTTKTIWVKYILESYHYNPKETCIIGDSIQDYQAAKDNHIYYYAYNNPEMKPLAEFYLEDYKILEK